jgi:phosphatidylinositol alpha-1,6-mannosyltransferase
VFRQSLGKTHFIYDACHLAQVHLLPGLGRKPFLTFLCGIEIWENAQPGYVRSARRARMLLPISRYTLERAERVHGPFPQAHICWLATEADELPPPAPPRSGPPQVLIVARLGETENKGHRELIDCWARVVQAVPQATLRIVGRGSGMAALQDRAARSPAAAQISFAGFVPDSHLEKLYQEATLFCMPSRQEGFGLVYIEAMRHGLPVVASIHDAAPEVVLEGETGYTVSLDRPDQLPERLIHLLRNPDLAQQMGEAGRHRWREHFRYSAFRDRFRPLLHQFLSQS